MTPPDPGQGRLISVLEGGYNTRAEAVRVGFGFGVRGNPKP